MNLFILRISPGEESTLGQLYLDHKPECFTLEDQFQDIKVKKETRIPNGRYRLLLNKNLTPMTERYRKQFTWFTYHIEVQEVEGFSNVYIHKGNTDDHTEGCILVGDSLTNNQYKIGKITDGFLGNSTHAYERIYKKIHTALMKDEEVWLDIDTYRV